MVLKYMGTINPSFTSINCPLSDWILTYIEVTWEEKSMCILDNRDSVSDFIMGAGTLFVT